MKLEDILPKNDDYILKNNTIYYKKIYLIEILTINEDGMYMLSLDNRITKRVLEIIKILKKNKIDFIFWIPNKQHIEFETAINFFLSTWINNKDFFYGFKKINFNPIKPFINFCIYYNCSSYIKDIYDDVNHIIQTRINYSFMGQNNGYEYEEEIRDRFKAVWREIIILLILNKKK